MSKERVMHLITRLIGGGAESMVDDAINALLQSDINCEVYLGFGYEYDQQSVEYFQSNGVHVQIFNEIRHYNPYYLAKSIISVSKFLADNEIDVLHTHSTEAGIVGRAAGRIAGTSVIIHSVHGVPFSSENSRWLNWSVQTLERICAHWSDSLVADSESSKQEFLSRGIGSMDQYDVIPPVIDLEQFCAVEGIDRPTDRFTFVFVGRIEKAKGIIELIEAFAIVSQERDVELLLVGDGCLKGEVVGLVDELGVSNSVEILGYRNDIPEILNGCDAFVLPTHREGFCIAVTEALAAGIPVISTPVGGVPEKIFRGKNGYLVPVGDVEKIADRMCAIIDEFCIDKEAIMGTVTEYSQEEVYDKYVELYSRILPDEN